MFKTILALCFLSTVLAQNTIFGLNILHYNDFHARFVETSPQDTACNPVVAPCIGGFARLTTAVRQAMAREPQSVLLNGGDSFQGTIWYNLLRWNVTQEFMNILPHDAHVFGNHEFDNGISGVVPYLEHLNAPVVTANIVDDDEPTIQGLYQPSIVIEREGRKIGIIGVIIASTDQLAATGQLKFKDEVETVKQEAQKLHEEGVNIIIVLSHCGLDIDRMIALNGGPHIDIIVGGHSHSLLYNGDPPVDSSFTPVGPYPVVVRQEDTQPVLIVQAAAHTQYLGEIKLYFDESGQLLDWEGHPLYLGNEIEQESGRDSPANLISNYERLKDVLRSHVNPDLYRMLNDYVESGSSQIPDSLLFLCYLPATPDVVDKINQYLPIIEELATVKVGSSLVHLSDSCTCGECNLGNFICDAFMNMVMEKAAGGTNWHYAHFCVINQGGIRTSIEAGDITFESVLLSTPFENNVEVFELQGHHIIDMLEFSVANDLWPGARMLQFSGIRPIFDGSRPPYQRLVNVTIRCIQCDVPRYETLRPEQYYKVVSQSFIGEGGDGFAMISDNRINVEVVGVDYDALVQFFEKTSPIFSEVEGRILINDPCSD